MKPCISCKQTKPIDQFYQHPAMKDGHLNKCIECCKVVAMNNRERKIHDPMWLALERERCRIKIAKYRAAGLEKRHTGGQERWRKKYPHKKRAQGKANKAERRGVLVKPNNCEDCGVESVRLQKHHPDYSQPLLVTWLCMKCHGKAHRLPFGTPIRRAA